MTGTTRESRGPDYFRKLYAANPDPWDFTGSAYEHEKYAATLAALPARMFGNALEVGCSIGVLTEKLASRCAALLGIDVVDDALAAAAARCRYLPHVTFQALRIPKAWPDRQFDLLVLSEVLYFLSPADIAHTAKRVSETILPGGIALLVNYTGPVDEPLDGDGAATSFMAAASALVPLTHLRRQRYRIDVLQAPVAYPSGTDAVTKTERPGKVK